ncbi:MAG: EamA family transporter, partial [Deltaproteobacteria bacterium]|nr:EamA family transporter [Deltaproteobacteria bacterium]
MIYLWIASLIWAFSFGLIKGELTGLPSSYVAMVRMALALLAFVPFFRPTDLKDKQTLQLFAIGMIQFGLMYILYIHAYKYLAAHEVALFTITTPFFVTLLHDLLEKKLNQFSLWMVLVCITGSAIIKYTEMARMDFWLGFAILQLANLCFAFGQVVYKRMFANKHVDQKEAFVPMYFGALCITVLATWAQVDLATVSPTARQWWVLLYLGLLPSGLCFFLWNKGAVVVRAGSLA